MRIMARGEQGERQSLTLPHHAGAASALHECNDMPGTPPWFSPRPALLGLLAVACSGGAAPNPPSAEASGLMRSVPVDEMERSLRAAVSHAAVFSSRRNVRVSPPGHWFATWMVEGSLPDQQVDALLFEIFAAAEGLVTAAGGSMRTPHERRGQTHHDGMESVILGLPPKPGAEAPRVLEAEYLVAGRRGWVTAMARPAARAGYWRIGGALHEP